MICARGRASLRRIYTPKTIISATQTVGSGFLQLLEFLPSEVLHVFHDIATLDRTMAESRLAGSDEYAIKSWILVRNAKVHELLSLPARNELNNGVHSKHHSLYEACRLTCILYVNAVMTALPSHNGWHKILVARLRFWLNSAMSPNLPRGIGDAILWCLCVGAIAAYSTADWTYFRSILHDLVEHRDDSSWNVMHGTLQSFMWTDSACERGAAIIQDILW